MPSNKQIIVNNTPIGDGVPPYLIAEIGLNHNGSLSLAHQLIDLAAVSGANMAKFQKRSINDLATADFLDAPFHKCPALGDTQRAVREKLELDKPQLQELQSHCVEVGLEFSFSIFDLPSLQIALEMNLSAIKVPSHSITNLPLLIELAKCGKPLFVSMGGSSWEERKKAYEILSSSNSDIVLFHCVSSYPTQDQDIKLHSIQEIRKRFDTLVGFSGHEQGHEVSAASVLLGACVIERHLTINTNMIGLDHRISLNGDEFSKLAGLANRYFRVSGIFDGTLNPGEILSRNNYHVSVVSSRKLKAGHVISDSDLVCKQPLINEDEYFTGMEIESVKGKKLVKDIEADKPIPRNAIT